MRIAGSLAAEVVLLALAAGVGGSAWAAVAAVACLAHLGGGIRAAHLAAALPAVAWPVAAVLTGNRELFFPFTMHLAAGAMIAASSRGTGLLTGGAVVGAFLMIRVAQHASPRVLAVELAAAAAVLAATAATRAWLGSDARGGSATRAIHWWLPVAAALVACACLAL